MNWFLYIITEDFIEDGNPISAGEAGVGECSMSPGIVDAPHGIMYIAPGAYVREEVRKKNTFGHPSAHTIREIIEDFYNKEKVIEISTKDSDFFMD